MSTYSGRRGAVTIEISSVETLVGELNNWSVNISGGSTDTSVFGDEWGKSDVGMLTWNGSASGFYDPSDSAQDYIFALLVSGALDGTLRLYTERRTGSGDPIKFWKPDTSADANAGVRVTAFNTSQTHSGVATFDLSFEGSGPVASYETTVP